MAAPNRADNATPASARRTGETAPRYATKNSTPAPARPPPAHAMAMPHCGICGSMTIAMALARPAAAVTPRIVGSASGLRVTPCRSAPATARAAPASMPSTSLGKRICQTMFRESGSDSDVRPCHTSAQVNSTAPSFSVKPATTTIATTPAERIAAGLAGARTPRRVNAPPVSLVVMAIFAILMGRDLRSGDRRSERLERFGDAWTRCLQEQFDVRIDDFVSSDCLESLEGRDLGDQRR